jgi:hypothetical protein
LVWPDWGPTPQSNRLEASMLPITPPMRLGFVVESQTIWRGRLGRDRMAVGFTTTCAISVCHYWNCEFDQRSWQGVLDTTLYDQVCQWLATGCWFSPGTSTNNTDSHDMTEILLKVALKTINHTKPSNHMKTNILK